MSEQSSLLLVMHSSLRWYEDIIVALEQELVSVPVDIKRPSAQYIADKGLLDVVRTAVDLRKTASQHRTSSPTRDREKLLADSSMAQT